MISTIKNNQLTWLDIEKPSAKDILFLKENFNLDPLVLDEFVSPSQRPRAEEFPSCLYIVIHIPLFDRKKKTTVSGELDIVITKNHLITSHTEENIPLKAVIKEFRENSLVKKEAMSKTVGFLFYFILEKLLSSCFPKIDHINENINKVEKEIFEGHEKEMVREISIIKRDVLSFRRTLKPQRSILESLVQKHYHLLEEDLNKYFQELIGINIRVWNAIENTKEVIESLEETNNSLLSYKINEAMRFLAAISLVTFTLSVTVGIFGMAPFENFAAAHKKETFWIILGFMGLITTGLLLIFKRKKWL